MLPSRPQALRLRRRRRLRIWSLLSAVGVPQRAQPAGGGLRGLHAAVARADLRLGVHGRGRGRGRLGVGRQPGGPRAALVRVVVSQDAADVRVVFGVAVGFGGEQRRAQGGDLRRCLGEDVGVPGCHVWNGGFEVMTSFWGERERARESWSGVVEGIGL